MTRHQASLMVLRVWTEVGSSVPLRVDVRHTHDLSRELPRALTLTDIDVVLDAVRTFLEAGRDPPTPRPTETPDHPIG